MKYSIVTFGCRVNQADSLRIEEDLRLRGAEEAPSAHADLVVVNTCSVTASADQGARQTIRRIARDNPGARILVTGCYATRSADEVAALPNVLRVVRNQDKEGLVDRFFSSADLPPSLKLPPSPRLWRTAVALAEAGRRTTVALAEAGQVGQVGAGATTADRFGDGEGSCGSAIEPGVAGRTAFTLRVQTGCEQTCAYCIIPTTRGAGRSVAVSEVLREVERIAAAGFKEIALTGVHLGSYGRDLTPSISLTALLRALADSPADVVFRISSLEPMDCTPDIVNLVATSGGRFAPHVHLPLQHAGDRMLALMRRPYTLGYYRALVDAVAARLPHASIGSDMIAGFPGETDADFRANLEYLPSSPLTHLHVFPYSDRPGTVATAMHDKVDGLTIRARGAQLRDIGAVLTRRFRDAQTATVRPGLTLEDGTLVVTDNYLKVRIPSGMPRNERVMVRIDADRMTATLVA